MKNNTQPHSVHLGGVEFPWTEIMRLASFGAAALLPGMVRMLEVNQAKVNEMRALIEAVEGAAFPKRRGRPPQTRLLEAPKAEGARRLHPRDKEHPKHEEWLRTISAAQKKLYRNMTPAQRAERNRKIQAGKRRAA